MPACTGGTLGLFSPALFTLLPSLFLSDLPRALILPVRTLGFEGLTAASVSRILLAFCLPLVTVCFGLTSSSSNRTRDCVEPTSMLFVGAVPPSGSAEP